MRDAVDPHAAWSSDRDALTATQTTAAASVRAQAGLVALFLATAALAWWWTAERMAGMDAGPGTGLGTLGWFAGAWAVMMAAMMLPSLAPAAAAHVTPPGRRRLVGSIAFAAGYLLVWSAAGVVAYTVFTLGRHLLGAGLAWRAGGRWLAGGVLALAALYELTPLKAACLTRCRFLRGRQPAPGGQSLAAAGRLGIGNGLWCVGCSWALMAALFALGVMSLTWMAIVAALVALEKVAPWRRPAVALSAGVLLLLAVALVAAPHDVPGLVVPGGASRAMHGMSTMHGMGAAYRMHGMSATHRMSATHGIGMR